MLADVILQALDSILPNHEPEFERAKSAPQGNLPVTIVDHRARIRGLIAQVFWYYTQTLDQGIAIGHIKTTAIGVGKHPFVGIEAIAVGKIQTCMGAPKFGT